MFRALRRALDDLHAEIPAIWRSQFAGEFERRYPQTTAAGTTGRPLEWDIVGSAAAVRDPTGYLTIQSTHASETFNAYVTGLAATTGASGTGLETVVKQENIALQGNTPVTLTTLFTKITSIAKETLSNGDYWILDAGASNAPVSFIPAGEIEARFRRLEFSFIPDADRSFRVKFRRKIPTLTADNQSPDPSVNSDYVIQKALALYQRYQDQHAKSQLHDFQAQTILEAESDREANFSQPFSQVIPFLPYAHDYYDDGYRGN